MWASQTSAFWWSVLARSETWPCPEIVEAACPELVEAACPEPVERACPEPVERTHTAAGIEHTRSKARCRLIRYVLECCDCCGARYWTFRCGVCSLVCPSNREVRQLSRTPLTSSVR